MRYIGQGMTRDRALSIAMISKHQYYYRPTSGRKPGRKASMHTPKADELVPNDTVTTDMRLIKKDEDTDYGYHRMTTHLK